MDAMIRNYRKWMPNHQPIWTTVGVTRLGADDMRCEMEVVAYDPEGAKSAWTLVSANKRGISQLDTSSYPEHMHISPIPYKHHSVPCIIYSC